MRYAVFVFFFISYALFFCFCLMLRVWDLGLSKLFYGGRFEFFSPLFLNSWGFGAWDGWMGWVRLGVCMSVSRNGNGKMYTDGCMSLGCDEL